MTGWRKSIIAPIDALLKPNHLGWKEKWGLIRCEWILDASHQIVGPVPPDLSGLLEAASHRCCAECGKWQGWLYPEDAEQTEVTTGGKGWVYTLCQRCRTAQDAKE